MTAKITNYVLGAVAFGQCISAVGILGILSLDYKVKNDQIVTNFNTNGYLSNSCQNRLET